MNWLLTPLYLHDGSFPLVPYFSVVPYSSAFSYDMLLLCIRQSPIETLSSTRIADEVRFCSSQYGFLIWVLRNRAVCLLFMRLLSLLFARRFSIFRIFGDFLILHEDSPKIIGTFEFLRWFDLWENFGVTLMYASCSIQSFTHCAKY